ncbi:HTH-type transcriptional repressor GlcR [Neomoorella glycerini]|uniref:HTH-type transcriptional repressor GlcR n=1 Tax=Neomoorella glycerini TaxID=55779 RepID=A0A6I5ZW62_9FIRM|nr:DeoR/GlpR family DNA-binding transcription regulator [Moorella glycerini]QGP93697.1 HTH-type transcriptional repressor GlcR [Moorella glycerini]
MQSKREMFILDTLKTQGAIEVADIAAALGVSLATVRRDLANLEAKGLLVKTRGGAILPGSQMATTFNTFHTPFETAYEFRAERMVQQKQAIGKLAATLVKPCDTIILDTGTTVIELARHIKNITPLTVITNAINVMDELRNCPEITVILLGGIYDPRTISVVGPLTEKALYQLRADKAFLAGGGLTVADGLMNNNLMTAGIKKAMAEISSRTIVLVDSSKIGSMAVIPIIPIEKISTIVTDKEADKSILKEFDAAGVEVMVA